MLSLEAVLQECMKCPDLVTLPPEPTRVPYKERESTAPAETDTKKDGPAEVPREAATATGAQAPSGSKGEMVCVGDVCFIKPAEKEEEPKLPECFKPPAQVMAMEAPPQGPAGDDDGNKVAPSDPSSSADKPAPADSVVPNDISNSPAADPVVVPTPAS